MERIEPIADFLNHCIDYEIKVTSQPSTSKTKPWYLRTDIYSNGSREWIIHLLRSMDVFVIAKDLRYPPMRLLENDLVREGKSCYNTDKYVNGDCAKDKIVFTTLSALKPSNTRKVAVVMTSEMTAQEIFRACSRATERLYIIDDARTDKIPLTIDERYLYNVNKRANGKFDQRSKRTEPSLSSDIPSYKVIQPALEDIPHIPMKSSNEFVADITGLAIPMIHEYRNTKHIKVIDLVKESKRCTRSYLRFFDTTDFSQTPSVLKLANIYITIFKGFQSKVVDIDSDEYNWLDSNILEMLLGRMDKYISKDAEYEMPVGKFRVDIIDRDVIWEIKCKTGLHSQDIQQIAKYANEDEHKRKYRLFNIYNDEILELETASKLNQI